MTGCTCPPEDDVFTAGCPVHDANFDRSDPPPNRSPEPLIADSRADWPAVERLAFEAAIRGDITRSRAAEIVGLRLRTWLDRFSELADEGDDALLDDTLKGWRDR